MPQAITPLFDRNLARLLNTTTPHSHLQIGWISVISFLTWENILPILGVFERQRRGPSIQTPRYVHFLRYKHQSSSCKIDVACIQHCQGTKDIQSWTWSHLSLNLFTGLWYALCGSTFGCLILVPDVVFQVAPTTSALMMAIRPRNHCLLFS